MAVNPNAGVNPLYLLKLHEIHTVGIDCTVMRVPGGWVYSMRNASSGRVETSVFVPYDDRHVWD